MNRPRPVLCQDSQHLTQRLFPVFFELAPAGQDAGGPASVEGRLSGMLQVKPPFRASA